MDFDDFQIVGRPTSLCKILVIFKQLFPLSVIWHYRNGLQMQQGEALQVILSPGILPAGKAKQLSVNCFNRRRIAVK